VKSRDAREKGGREGRMGGGKAGGKTYGNAREEVVIERNVTGRVCQSFIQG